MPKRIAIIGAGMGGLCAAIRAREAGHEIAIFEAADDVGGTWRANRYPGVACDVPAILYQFSFAPNPHWSHNFARGAEIQAYARGLVEQFGLEPYLHLSEEVVRATWDETAAQWAIETTAGRRERFDVLVPALGQLSRPTLPDIPGIDRFAGAIWHAAQWPAGADLIGKGVGVIGTAASAVQLIPEIVVEAERLVVFQRTANWCVPRGDLPVTDEAKRLAATNLPVAMKLGAMQREMIFAQADAFFWQTFEWTPEGRAATERTALDHLHAQVADPDLRRKLTPDYPIGCKRILFTDDYYPALTGSNVVLETSGIVAIEPDGVRTADGVHQLDRLIFATGFETTQWAWSLAVHGVGGRTLAVEWAGGPSAYLGIMVAGFPNMFMLYGPNTNLAHNSISYMIECQVNYLLAVLAALDETGSAAAEVTADAQRAFCAAVDARNASSVWADPHCRSWYKAANGRIVQNWAGNCAEYRAQTATVDPNALSFA